MYVIDILIVVIPVRIQKRMSMDLLKVADLNCKLPCKETVADASVAIIPRKPGSLPVTAMNVCEYNGIMMD